MHTLALSALSQSSTPVCLHDDRPQFYREIQGLEGLQGYIGLICICTYPPYTLKYLGDLFEDFGLGEEPFDSMPVNDLPQCHPEDHGDDAAAAGAGDSDEC